MKKFDELDDNAIVAIMFDRYPDRVIQLKRELEWTLKIHKGAKARVFTVKEVPLKADIHSYLRSMYKSDAQDLEDWLTDLYLVDESNNEILDTFNRQLNNLLGEVPTLQLDEEVDCTVLLRKIEMEK